MKKLLTNVYFHITILALVFIVAACSTGSGEYNFKIKPFQQAGKTCFYLDGDAYASYETGVYCKQ